MRLIIKCCGLTHRQEIIWGLNYRYTDNHNRGKGLFALEPTDSQDNVVSAFVQDQIAIAESLRLTLGAKLEAELDLRLAWHGWERVEIAIVGQNLLHDHHAEFGSPAGRGETERSVYGKVTWGF